MNRKHFALSIGFILGLIAITNCNYKPRNQGRSLYEKHCQSCHMENGQGLGALIPPVANADFVLNNMEQLACIIKYGMQGEITVNGVVYNDQMEGNARLTDVEINNIIYYILVELNGQNKSFEIGDVKAHLDACKR